MERLRIIVAEVKDRLITKEQEMEHAGHAAIPYLLEELKKRRHEVISFELSLEKVRANSESQPSLIDKFRNEAQELLIEIDKIVI